MRGAWGLSEEMHRKLSEQVAHPDLQDVKTYNSKVNKSATVTS